MFPITVKLNNSVRDKSNNFRKEEKNVPSHQLGHIPPGRQNIPLKAVNTFLEERFDRFKEGTDFQNLEIKFDIGKRKAQRILKRGKEKKVFFTPLRKNPQQYFPESRRYKVTDRFNNLNNVPKDTTGTRQFNSPLSYAMEQQKASNFLEALLFARYISRQIHKIQLEVAIDKKKMLDKDYYGKMPVSEWSQNKGKAIKDFIDERKIEFVHYKNKNVMISISCNEKPFNIETEEDILNLFSFFGQVRDRLEYQMSDARGRLVAPIGNWI